MVTDFFTRQWRAFTARKLRGGGGRPAPATSRTARELAQDYFPRSRLTVAQKEQVCAWQQEIAAEPDKLQALFVAALLDTDTPRAKRQLLQLAPLLGASVAAPVPRMRAVLYGLPSMVRLPLLARLMPALRALPDDSRLRMVRVVRAFSDQLTPQGTLRFAVSRLVLRTLVRDRRVAAGSSIMKVRPLLP